MNPTIIMLVVLGGMMFFMTRSQKKQQQKRQEVLNSMTVGNKVVTVGGLHGVISEIDQVKDTVWLDCEGIQLEFNRASIASVTPATTEAPVVEAAIIEETMTDDVEETVVVEEIIEPVQETEKTEDK